VNHRWGREEGGKRAYGQGGSCGEKKMRGKPQSTAGKPLFTHSLASLIPSSL